jgi:branched-subunit amino acid aminotransferase/4-amino-4-deoxychorismate lyase
VPASIACEETVRLSNGEFSPLPHAFDLERLSHEPPAVFTTFLVRPSPRGPCIFDFERHILRLIGNAESLGVRCGDIDEHHEGELLAVLPTYLGKRARKLAHGDAMRVRAVMDPDGVRLYLDLFTRSWPAGGASVVTVHAERPQPEVKCTHARASLAARKEADRRGAHEALLIDDRGIVREGAWSNFFWLDRSGRWHTPGGVLPGVTRAHVLATQECLVDDVSLAELKDEAVAAVLTQATMLATPVARIDNLALDPSDVRCRAFINSLEESSRHWALVLA